ncbi:MAG: type I secretion system permease/ATPase [Pseudomonadota bacterium]
MPNISQKYQEFLSNTKKTFSLIIVFSFVINLLMLTGPLFMLQIYDRVLTSGSVETLVALSILVVVLYLFMGALELVRTRILARIANGFDAVCGASAFLHAVRQRIQPSPVGAGSAPASDAAPAREPVRDLDRVRQFLSSTGVAPLFDIPWLPAYHVIVYLIHPILSIVAITGTAVLFLLALAADRVARPLARASGAIAAERHAMAGAAARNAEAVAGMGMEQALGQAWEKASDRYLDKNLSTNDAIGASGVVSKVFRLFIQSAMLGVGAYLALIGEISAGAIIAASIIMARGLQPVESAVQNWRNLIDAHAAYRRMRTVMDAPEEALPGPDLPTPERTLSVSHLTVTPPRASTATLTDVSFSAAAGEAVGVIGHSGSGKSTLARALVGVWRPTEGTVLLDGTPLSQFGLEARSTFVGYLPQDVELFAGSVRDNIARFRDDASDDEVIGAAQAAGCHEMIAALPQGYGTSVGEAGHTLSAGQRQRIALARALYGAPFLVVLDEPNSNLDGHGDTALHDAIKGAKARGAVVVVVAHRPSALSAADTLCLIENGQLAEFGPRDEVLRKVMRRHASTSPAEPVGDGRADESAPAGARTDGTP